MNGRIRVLHLVEHLAVGGMENGLVNLANHFDYNLFDFMICCFRQKGELAERLWNPRAQLLDLHRPPGVHLDAVFGLARLMRRHRVHIVHTHGWGARSLIGLLSATLARVPICVNGEHGQLHVEKRRQFLVQKAMFRLFDDNLSVSEGLKDKIYGQFGLSRNINVTVIPNGVDTVKFNGDYPTIKLRKQLGIDTDTFLLGVIGSLKRQKNQKVVIHALSLLKSATPDVRLILAGDGPDRRMLECLASELNVSSHTLFLGIRQDIPQLLSLMDVLVSPSIHDFEGMSNVILEAMASKVPVVATNSVGMRELIDDGKTGLLFDPDDPAGLVRKILVLKDDFDLRDALARNAREKVRQEHSLEVMTRRYQDYYLGLCDRMICGV